jgi:hypothetical protein
MGRKERREREQKRESYASQRSSEKRRNNLIAVGVFAVIAVIVGYAAAPAYQIKSSWIHFEGNDGTTIHKHATGVTLGYLFESLGLGLDDQCYEFQDGRSFCTNEDYSLKFFINGEQVNDIRDYEINEDDKILVSYGVETQEEIEKELLELEAMMLVK